MGMIRMDGKKGVTESEIGKCVHCGFCLESCPTYVVTRSEVHSPRGRILTVKLGLSTEGIETCMYCRRCEIACPSGVEYNKIITSARKPDMFKKIMLKTLERPSLLYVGTLAVSKGNGEFSYRLRNFVENPQKPLEHEEMDPDIYLIPGCITSTFFRSTVEKALKFLKEKGFRVKILNGCCGLAHYSEGDVEGGDKALDRLIPTSARTSNARLVSLSSNCTAHMREKGINVMDFHEFMKSMNYQIRIGTKFTVHYPCHAHLLGITKSLIDVFYDRENMVQMEDPSFECGAGGAFFLFNQEISDKVIQEKNRKVKYSVADIVISTNPSCSLVMKKSGKRVMHIADFL
ncbi:(Fe-S)-binding protein [Sulfuracidifex tepidarius]|uniref:Lactate utilization protein A n=1 Tax=Sulfuracidifex tepidarius TaxID=1294262 RepID=A0A510E600_9CREN|nr:(Fe-S)-binding protein [Sulfuracidifex tepidarius]BBG27460.1 Lactate utilization protein A [Sulfuracidifex tepidarius]